MSPAVSVLITTYQRKEMVRRAIQSVISQTFTDLEIVIIDDASIDGTVDAIPKDPRITYIYNQENLGAKHGDRIHLKRFVNEYARGKYFIYLCSDDYWMFDTLLARQIALMNAYPEASMVIGGQMSDFGNEQKFHQGIYPQAYMLSREFIDHFSKHPIECNIIIGATLYNMEKFKESNALKDTGAKWQAGYEMLMGPGQYGDVVYIDEPCVMTEITPSNASFQGTQLDHYLDCVKSVMAAKLPLEVEKETLHNIGQAFLRNAEHIAANGSLTMCSEYNISKPVTKDDIVC